MLFAGRVVLCGDNRSPFTDNLTTNSNQNCFNMGLNSYFHQFDMEVNHYSSLLLALLKTPHSNYVQKIAQIYLCFNVRFYLITCLLNILNLKRHCLIFLRMTESILLLGRNYQTHLLV